MIIPKLGVFPMVYLNYNTGRTSRTN